MNYLKGAMWPWTLAWDVAKIPEYFLSKLAPWHFCWCNTLSRFWNHVDRFHNCFIIEFIWFPLISTFCLLTMNKAQLLNKNSSSLQEMSLSSQSADLQQDSEKSVYTQEKERLVDFQCIKSDLESFSCRCRPMCFSMEDATFVGQVRNTVLKLGGRSKVWKTFESCT